MSEKKSIGSILKVMKVGESRNFPAEKYRSVAVISSDLGFVMGRKYKICRKKETREVTVTRET